MPRRSNAFQRLIVCIEEQLAGEDVTVRESVELEEYPGSSRREVDVVLEAEVSGHLVRIALECRDQKRRQSKPWIDELHGKYRDLPIDKVVAVSSSGFTKGAVEKARQVGIETLTFAEALESEWPSRFRKFYARFLVHRVVNLSARIEYSEEGSPMGDDLDLDLIIESGAGEAEGSVHDVVIQKILPDAKLALRQTIDARAEELLRETESRYEDFAVRYEATDRYIRFADGTRRQIGTILLRLGVEFSVQPATSESRFIYKRAQVMLCSLEDPNVTRSDVLVLQAEGQPLRVRTGAGWTVLTPIESSESQETGGSP